jgi:hypothetical protein
MEPVRQRWVARAADRALTQSQNAYAARRAIKIERPYEERLDGCGVRGAPTHCGCRGRKVAWFTCRAHLLCRDCRKSRARQLRPRVWAALDRMHAAAPREMLVMMTITLRHSGDVGADRRELMLAWKRFRKAYGKRWGAFPFVGTHEITPGTDGAGHPHAHVVCRWPWRDWSEVREMWLRASPQSERVDFKASKNPKNAARYVSKYATKGVQTDDFTPELRAFVIAGTYNTRWLFSSRNAWVPFVPCCKACGQRTTRDGVVWRDRIGTWVGPSPDWYDDRHYQRELELGGARFHR